MAAIVLTHGSAKPLKCALLRLLVSNGVATNLRNSVFSIINSNVTEQIYQVDALDVNTDGIVTIKATNFPVDANGATVIGADIVSENTFIIVGDGAPS
jgi:hypothetical protein